MTLWRLALAAVAGAVAAFGLAPYGATPLGLIALAALPWLLRDQTPRFAGWIGWAFATGYFAHALHWIVEPFFVDAARTGWMAPFALIFMAGGLALFWALAAYLAQWVGQSWRGRTAVLILALGFAEFLRAYAFTGFPWAGLAQIWLDTGLEGSLAYIGPHGLGLWTLCIAFGAAHATARASMPHRALLVSPAAVALLALALLALREPDVRNTDFTIRLVQPNAPQHQKWDPAHAPTFLDRQLKFSAEAGAPDLIVWPETAIAYWHHQAAPIFDAIAAFAGDSPVVLGLLRTPAPEVYHNALVTLDTNGTVTQLYDKHHLVPFGEYVPMRALANRIGLAGLASPGGNFTRGPGPRLIDLGDIGTAIPLICYEAVFPQHSVLAGERPNLLVQITNDAWFGTWSGPYQHLAQSRMRAIEQGLPMVRAANTGISAMIDPLGRVTARLALNTAGYLDANLPHPLPPTLYSRTGDTSAFLLLCAALLVLRSRKRRAKRAATR